MRWYIEEGQESDVVLSTRVRLARNLSTYLFPSYMTYEVANECYSEIINALLSANNHMKDLYISVKLSDLHSTMLGAMVERRILSEDIVKKSVNPFAIIRKDEGISVLLGDEDHIRIQAMRPGLQFAKAYRDAENVSLILEERLPIAFSRKYGFLTSCPSNVGTGMRVSALLHLPVLGRSKYFSGYIDKLRKMGVAVRGEYGEHSDSEGFLYQISNQMTSGISEEETISEIGKIVDDIIQKERVMRNRWLNDKRWEVEDRIYRSWGTLNNSRLLSRREASVLLSDVRLGVSLGLIRGITQAQLNSLSVDMGSSSIQNRLGSPLSPKDRDFIRAKIFREELGKFNQENHSLTDRAEPADLNIDNKKYKNEKYLNKGSDNNEH